MISRKVPGDEFCEVVAVWSLSLVYPWAGPSEVGRSGAGKGMHGRTNLPNHGSALRQTGHHASVR